MKVYVDLIFILNVLLDFILLMSVSVTLTRNATIKRLFLGSLMGGVSTFSLFLNIGSVSLIFIKVILGILMVIISFGYQNIKYTFNNLFYLYTISFSVGGVLYIFMDNGYYNYFILIIVFIIICYLYIKQRKIYKTSYINYYKVEIYYKNKCLKLTGYLDTGNKLYDIYKHRPIILIDKMIKYNDDEIIYVPYESLNNVSILKCFKADMIIINKHIFYNYLVGLSNNEFKIDGINCILHSKMKGNIE